MKSWVRSILTLSLATSMVFATMSGCANKGSDSASKSAALTDDTKTEETLTVFSSFANYQGEMKGWAAKILKDKLNVKLNIIAPNVAGGGDSLYSTRSAAGDLGDIIMLSSDKLAKTIKAGLFYDMNSNNLISDYGKVLEQYPAAIKKCQTNYNTGSHIYIMPDEVSTQKATVSKGMQILMNGLFTRFDYYQALGCPKLSSMDDVVDLLANMQKAYPKAENDKKTYGISLWKDWDYYCMNAATCIGSLYGWSVQNLCEYNVDATQIRSILDKDSYYLQNLKFYYELNQKGLLDPDSTTQNFTTAADKYGKGQALLGFWAYQGLSQYNTTAHNNEGKGFWAVPLEGEKVISSGCNPTGGTYGAGIGIKCKNVVRAMKVLNYLYSSEGTKVYDDGPEGLCWTVKDGKNEATSFIATVTGETKVPTEYGGGTWSGGAFNNLNWCTETSTDIEPATGEAYNYVIWSSYGKLVNNKIKDAFAKQYNVEDPLTYYENNDQIAVQPGNNYTHQTESTDVKTTENQIANVVKQYSWKMVFASSTTEFESLYNKMVEQANGLGLSSVLEFDKKDLSGLAKAIAKAEEESK